MRKCCLDNVPIILKNNNKVINWQNAIGLDIPFEYDGIKDSFKIIDYDFIKIKNICFMENILKRGK